jgi:hypothetical protein
MARSRDVAFLVLAPFIVFFQAGLFIAEWEMATFYTYTIVTTKGASIENARLLRASSAGFIVFTEESLVLLRNRKLLRLRRRRRSSPSRQKAPVHGDIPPPWASRASAPGKTFTNEELSMT